MQGKAALCGQREKCRLDFGLVIICQFFVQNCFLGLIIIIFLVSFLPGPKKIVSTLYDILFSYYIIVAEL